MHLRSGRSQISYTGGMIPADKAPPSRLQVAPSRETAGIPPGSGLWAMLDHEVRRPAAPRLKALRQRTGLSAPQVARAVGREPTSYRYYEDRYDKPLIPVELAMQLVRVFEGLGVEAAEVLALAGIDAGDDLERRLGLADAETTPWQPEGDPLAGAVAALVAGRDHVTPWLVRGRTLVSAGCLPGDVLIVDHHVLDPPPAAIVCAQLYGAGGARTVLRLWQPPYLVGPPDLVRPIAVDDEHAAIRGTAIAVLRDLAGD